MCGIQTRKHGFGKCKKGIADISCQQGKTVTSGYFSIKNAIPGYFFLEKCAKADQ